MQKKSKIIIISIVSALILLLGVVTAIALTGKGSDTEKVATEKLSLGQKFLLDLEYDKAVAEFQAVIDIEPKNVDAYIGLAEAYIGMGDEEKAIETLEKGLSETGDEKIQAKLNEMKKPEETTAEVTTVATTTAQEQPEMTMEEVINISEKYKKYLQEQILNINEYLKKNGYSLLPTKEDEIDYTKIPDLVYLINYDYISKEERDKLIDNNVISKNMEEVIDNSITQTEKIALWNSSYVDSCYKINVNVEKENLISFENLSYTEKDLNSAKEVHNGFIESIYYRPELAEIYLKNKNVSTYIINEESNSFDYLLKYYDIYSRGYCVLEYYNDEQIKILDEISDKEKNEIKSYINEKENVK